MKFKLHMATTSKHRAVTQNEVTYICLCFTTFLATCCATGDLKMTEFPRELYIRGIYTRESSKLIHSISNHTLATLSSHSYLTCGEQCFRYMACTGVNYKTSDRTCVLLTGTKGEYVAVYDDNWMYMTLDTVIHERGK